MSNQADAIKNIFLAEDNKEHRLLFEKAIVAIDRNIRLTTVTNGEELLQLLSHYVPELLFLDLEMPSKNGMQCLQAIRANKTYDTLPIVVFTATRRSNNIQLAYGMGANLFFAKPPDYEVLVLSLRAILQMDWEDPEAITARHFVDNHYFPFQLQDLTGNRL
jgi:DNA-binding response OmpR family regulator